MLTVISMITSTKTSTQKKSDWVYVPGGSALIGADDPGEGPQQLLDIPAFWISRYALSNAEFDCFIQDGGYHRPELWDAEGLLWLRSQEVLEPAFWRDSLFNLPDQPVTGVSFYEAQAYARWLSARLPTEAQWEKAARGTRGALYPWGDDEPNTLCANFAPGFVPINRSPIPVQECADGDSPYGCRQMAGNVYEWCLDFFHSDTPTLRSTANPIELRPSRRRVMKGGSWGSGSSRLRPSARWSSPAELRDNVIGFRLVHDLYASSGQQGGEI
jgi:gamma-glutamyl hercynylcysteine S-oxide synthase